MDTDSLDQEGGIAPPAYSSLLPSSLPSSVTPTSTTNVLMIYFANCKDEKVIQQQIQKLSKVCRTLYFWSVEQTALSPALHGCKRDDTTEVTLAIKRSVERGKSKGNANSFVVHILSHAMVENGKLRLFAESFFPCAYIEWNQVQRSVQSSCQADVVLSLDCCVAGHIEYNTDLQKAEGRKEVILACSSGQSSLRGSGSFTEKMTTALEYLASRGGTFGNQDIVNQVWKESTKGPSCYVNPVVCPLHDDARAIELAPSIPRLWQWGDADAASLGKDDFASQIACIVYSPCKDCFGGKRTIGTGTVISYVGIAQDAMPRLGSRVKLRQAWSFADLHSMIVKEAKASCGHRDFRLKHGNNVITIGQDLGVLSTTDDGVLVMQAIPIAKGASCGGEKPSNGTSTICRMTGTFQ